MSKRIEILNSFYDDIDEDSRLDRSRHGQLEYITTMNYIHRYAKAGAKILEIGAGTGRYSITLAKEGYKVTAVELVESNLEVLRKNGSGIKNIVSYQGDALNLDRFEDNKFDITLLFGPMYHLYDKKDVHKALDEAIRVTKKGGIILTAFLSVYAIMNNNYLKETLAAGIKMNFDDDYKVKHFEEQLFTGYDITEFEQLFESHKTKYLTTVAVDNILESAEGRTDFKMQDKDFELFVKYHLATCEKRELLGASSHLLYICKKED
ncbi:MULTISPECIES: bifunctional 2-polyprenyl-6-hydroxyphenol methylase/3-demethylubiquinol 3-O-methyltransferase UbiG [unclassified Treponema]|uniref:class I SAM-dependent methyltransferase n=1 Tax=unclassified Treponema TaxID=2638727 RepID=UPI0020A2C351|nr:MULTISPECIES: class I SAM-dependent methyltransferase [unclassified Treponema]UTC67907.1 class I SAM-dependent methyltransferase [Treponema sp. OMZ 789]UTC70628.1 class I SAM-dependent methyltransferase [Treponema sp. OMZ 790]UTC73340.1 class I SAM-dependent methyltransferase [Treponema sp. OMZ 791]UTC73347.1 class I SAM-dependent methyltransferase [Treponema sp. OMZ 791]UTC73353.1 class I SAM-dependent methyltransferase [Treponema sp. OMZ 791]